MSGWVDVFITRCLCRNSVMIYKSLKSSQPLYMFETLPLVLPYNELTRQKYELLLPDTLRIHWKREFGT